MSHDHPVYVEDGLVIRQQRHDGDQYIIRIEAPRCAAAARPGTFAHVTCDPAVPMRRPLSIMRASPADGWIELLYKIVGGGLAHLASRRAGDTVSLLGPIGNPFTLDPHRRRLLMIGGGVGIPPMVFLAENLAGDARADWQALVLMGSEIPFPFTTRPSTILVPGMPDGVIAGMPLLDRWGVASRLSSLQGYPGCHRGFVTDLARIWLTGLDDTARDEVAIFACGPTPMLKAAAGVAREFGVPCQVSLEEFMACAVGGCAGCTVEVQTPDGPAMKRVCVDGPVFDAAAVYPR